MRQLPISEILGHFPLQAGAYRFQPLGQGLIHDTYLVSESGEAKYILQRLNTDVFHNIRALMGNMEKALPLLNAKDYTRMVLVKTVAGAPFADAGALGCWRLVTYLRGSTTFDTTNHRDTAYEAGRIISRFHSLLKDAPPDAFEDTLPGFHNFELRSSQLKDARKTASAARLNKAEKALGMAGGLMQTGLPFKAGALPLRVCHNDTKLNNILFNKVSGLAMCLIDLDTVMKGYLMYDFGDAVRTIANTAPEDESDPGKISFSKPLFEAFTEGFCSAGLEITREEAVSLPCGVVYMPMLHGMRALTDYLSGDIYYKVSTPEQNLNRSISLLTFAQRAAEHMEYMQQRVMFLKRGR